MYERFDRFVVLSSRPTAGLTAPEAVGLQSRYLRRGRPLVMLGPRVVHTRRARRLGSAWDEHNQTLASGGGRWSAADLG
jgi:hypothetical protein